MLFGEGCILLSKCLNKPTVAIFLSIVVSLIAFSCGSGNEIVQPKPDPSAIPKQIEPTTFPTQVAKIPTEIPTEIPTKIPTKTPTSEPPPPTPTSIPVMLKIFDEYGFSLGLDKGGLITAMPDSTASQGIVRLEYAGVNFIMTWVPLEGVTNEGLVAGIFNLLSTNQPDLTLEAVSESDIDVGPYSGLVLGFRSLDGSGSVTGGGLVSSWPCLETDTAFTLTATGEDAAVLQLRLRRLLDNFNCSLQ